MSLDLTQNIILYLSLLSTLLVVIMLFRFRNLSSTNRKTHRILRRLKYEINKIQVIDSHIAESITDIDTINSWLEDDKRKNEEKLKNKELKKNKRLEKIKNLRSKLPKNLDLFAGEQIIDKIGIASFLIGLAFFVNVSMELEWINSFGRLFFGILLTIIFLISGYFIRNKYVHFSNILIGGGIGALIFTLFAAFYQYQLIPLAIWFILTVLIISSSIIISISVKRHEIAIITFVAAYIAPFTVNFIGTDYFILFSYITLLNIGVLIYDFFQKSIVINLISFGFTFIIYGIWLISLIYFKNEEIPYLGAFIFLTLFYIMFLAIMIINNVREGHEFKNIEFSILMSAKAIYLSVGIIIINAAGVELKGLFMGLIAIINYSFFLYLFKRKNIDRRILNVFLSLSIIFAIMVVPVEFYGKSVTLIIALQSFALMFIAVRSKLEPMKLSSFFLTIGMIGSLIFDLYLQYFSNSGSIDYAKPFLNQSFLTSIVAIISLVLMIALLLKDKEEFYFKKFVKIKYYIAFLAVVAATTFYFSFFFEIKYWALQKFNSPDTIDTITSVYNYFFLALATIPIWFVKQKQIALVTIIVSILASTAFVFHYAYIFTELRNSFLLSSKVTQAQFAIHYYAVFLIVVIQISSLRAITYAFPNGKTGYFVTSLIVFFILYTFSTENSQIFTVHLYEPHILIQNIVSRLHKFSYSITWSIVSFILVLLGFLFKSKAIRTNAILVFFLTTVKIMTFDLLADSKQDIMISFAILGIVLLLSSFVFQINKNRKLKKTES